MVIKDWLKRLGFTLIVVKTSFAVTLSYWLATVISNHPYPYFAPLSAVLTLQVTIADSIEKAVYRFIGIVLGVLISLSVSYLLILNPMTIGFVILLGMAGSSALKLNPQITSQIAISTLLILSMHDLPIYATSRVIETMIGSIVALLVNAFVIPPNEIPKAEHEIRELTKKLSQLLLTFVKLMKDKTVIDDENTTKEVIKQTKDAMQALTFAEQSLKYSPFLRKRRNRIRQLADGLIELEKISVQIRGIKRGLMDYKLTIHEHSGLQNAIQDTAICIDRFGEYTLTPSSITKKRLACSIECAKKSQDACLHYLKEVESLTALRDIGAILTDLHRIIREVSTIMIGEEPTREDQKSFFYDDLKRSSK